MGGGGQSRSQTATSCHICSHSCLVFGRPQAVNNCTLALKIDADSSKAFYRRAYAGFAKKDYDGAKADLLNAQKNSPGDKAVATLLKKVRAGPQRVLRSCARASYAPGAGGSLLAFRAPSVGIGPGMVSAGILPCFFLPQPWLSSTSSLLFSCIVEAALFFRRTPIAACERC